MRIGFGHLDEIRTLRNFVGGRQDLVKHIVSRNGALQLLLDMLHCDN